jgi:hypothetical protein
MLDITSQLFTPTCLQSNAVVYTKFVGMFTVYLYNKFHMPSSYGSIIVPKLKAK